MAYRGNDVKPGHVIQHKGRLCLVVKTAHTQPGKGGAYIQVELKNIKCGSKYNERLGSKEDVKRAELTSSEFNYMFSDTDGINLMNPTTYDQITVKYSTLGEKKCYLQEGMKITIEYCEGEIISAKVPDRITLEVTEADAVIKGQTASSSYKPAILENGLRITVPPHIQPGDKVVVNTSDDSYHEKAKEK